MGFRLHSARKWDVEWSSVGGFNHKGVEIIDKLRSAEVDILDCIEDYPTDFSVSVKDIREYIEDLKAITPDEDPEAQEEAQEWERILKDAYDDDGYYHLSWF